MRKLDQKGFTVVEGLLIAVAVLLLGFGGYYVYSQNTDDDNVARQGSTDDLDYSESVTDETNKIDEEQQITCAEYFDETKILDGSINNFDGDQQFFLYQQDESKNASAGSGIFTWAPVVTTDDYCMDKAYIGKADDIYQVGDAKYYLSPGKDKALIKTQVGDAVQFFIYGTDILADDVDIYDLMPDDYKNQGQYGINFEEWTDNDTFTFNFSSALGNTYLYKFNVMSFGFEEV